MQRTQRLKSLSSKLTTASRRSFLRVEGVTSQTTCCEVALCVSVIVQLAHQPFSSSGFHLVSHGAGKGSSPLLMLMS